VSEVDGIGMTSQRSRNRLVDSLRKMGIKSEKVLEVIRTVPRHLFVDEALASRAYENTALPIGYGQTISQPYTVALMTEALCDSGSMKKVLEIGSGCGYQTAVLAQVSRLVFGVERVKGLFVKTEQRLRTLKFLNTRLKHGDGFEGWAANASYDAILVAAAPVSLPTKLIGQLSLGGRLVIPVGRSGKQELRMYIKTSKAVEEKCLEAVSFVPLLDGIR
jgi:protein-L-isoaspartate(D-aspartate) O-methyltransferase